MKLITLRKFTLAVIALLFVFAPIFLVVPQSFAATDNTCQPGQGHCSPGSGPTTAPTDTGSQDPQGSANGLNSNCDPNGSGVGTGSGDAGCIPCVPVSQATSSDKIQAYIKQYKAQYKNDHPNATDTPTPVVCGDTAANPNANCDQNGCDLVKKYVNPTINVLSIIVGLMAVISIIIGAIQYITSTGDPQKVSAAKGRISKTIFAFVAYAFLYAFLQFIIPGGIF